MSRPALPPVILTDIEGTTSSIDFVKDVLFPYADTHIADFVVRHSEDPVVRAQLRAAQQEGGIEGQGDAATVALLRRWIAQDRKATPLKALQGMIWEHGYKHGDFVAHVYPDAVDALKRWHGEGKRLYVYSSGSIQAQKLFFAHTGFGDLTPLFSGYFDTTSGGKREASSYRHIVQQIGVEPGAVLFLSDIQQEIEAARQAGVQTHWIRRDLASPEAAAQVGALHSFAQI